LWSGKLLQGNGFQKWSEEDADQPLTAILVQFQTANDIRTLHR
jgi:hypothetical protein